MAKQTFSKKDLHPKPLERERKDISSFLSTFLTKKIVSVQDYLATYPQSDLGSIKAVLVFLQTFNVVSLKFTNKDIIAKVVSPFANSFIASLKVYIEDKLSLISDWKNILDDETTQEDLLGLGSNLLHTMERRRSKELGSDKTLSEVDVVLLFIKAKVDGYDDSQFLFQFNLKTNRFQLIGGYKKDKENESKAADRLIKKELPLNNLPHAKYDTSPINSTITFKDVSRKNAVYTKYNLYYLFLKFRVETIKLKPRDRWISLEEMINGKTIDNITIVSPFKAIKDEEAKKSFIQKLKDLPLSFNKEQPKGPNEKIKIEQTVVNNNDSTLEKFLQNDESKNLEFKSSMRWDYVTQSINKVLEKTIVRSIASFFNTSGGTLIIGVNDEKQILGIDNDIQTLKKKNLDGYSQQVTALVSSYIGSELSSFIDVTFENSNGKSVCIISLKRTPFPVFLKEGENRHFYIRSGNTSRELNSEETYKYTQMNW